MSKVYTGTGRAFQEITPLPMDEDALSDVSKRVKIQPHFLGEPLVVVAETADFNLTSPSNTLGLVTLDTVGRCVAVAIASGMADVDSIMLALQITSITCKLNVSDLGRLARAFVNRPENEALLSIWEEHDVEMNEETVELLSLVASIFERDAENYADRINREQRIIVAAETYSARLLRVISWLYSSGVNAIGLRFRRYMVAGQEIYFAEQVAPALDPVADDAIGMDLTPRASSEMSEPWKVKGHSYHSDRLTPKTAILMDSLLHITSSDTFTVQWNHKHYFWIRGLRRNLRVRTYYRDRLELGFYSAAPAAVSEFLTPYGLSQQFDVTTVGGYADSPFITLPGETTVLDERWKAMLSDWLTGASPGHSRVLDNMLLSMPDASDRSLTESGTL